MKKIIFVFSIIVLLSTHTKAQEGFGDVLMQKQAFYEARLELESMLAGDVPLDYERAVFVMENAYRGNTIDYAVYEEVLDFHTQNIRLLAEANRDSVLEGLPDVMFETEEQKQERYDMLLNNWAIYHYMTDTTIIRDEEFEYVHMPYRYSYSDPMGVLDWKHTQVMNLLDNKAGNCYAMVNLYMIFAKRLGTDARIGVAPGHVFVMHDGMDGREYFVELSNGSFPGTGTIMTLSYSPLEAVKEGISMRELSEEQAVGMCLVYLGKGYEQSFETKTDGFIYGCAETALEHDSLNLNAMLLKTEVLEERLWSTSTSLSKQEEKITQLQENSEFREYEALVAELYSKGYREMPQDMKNLIIRGLQKDEGGIILKDNTPTGFQTIDEEGERYATLSWGLFDEVHEPKDVERYGRALFDIKTRKIVALSEVDSLYNRYPMDIGVFAMAVDPLAADYTSLSPYAFVGNMPIAAIDPDGRKIKIVWRDDNGKKHKVKITNMDEYNTFMQAAHDGEFINDLKIGLNFIKSYDDGDVEVKVIEAAIYNNKTIKIKQFNKKNPNKTAENDAGTTMWWNSLNVYVTDAGTQNEKRQAPVVSLYHDLFELVLFNRKNYSEDMKYIENSINDAINGYVTPDGCVYSDDFMIEVAEPNLIEALNKVTDHDSDPRDDYENPNAGVEKGNGDPLSTEFKE